MNQAFIDNVARKPKEMLNAVSQRPTILADECPTTVATAIKIWAREGLVQRLEFLEDAAGIPLDIKLMVRRVIAKASNAAVARS